MRSHVSLLFSKLNKSSDLSCSSKVLPLRPFNFLVSLLWTHSNSFMPFLYWDCQNCTQCSKVGPHHCRAGWDNHLPRLADCAMMDGPQDMIGPFGYQGIILTHVQLTIHPNSLWSEVSHFITVTLGRASNKKPKKKSSTSLVGRIKDYLMSLLFRTEKKATCDSI